MLIYKTKPSEVFKRKEISSNLNGNEEESVEVKISSRYADPTKSPITISVQGVPTYLVLLQNNRGGIIKEKGRLYNSPVTTQKARQYKEVLEKVKDNLEPPTQT